MVKKLIVAGILIVFVLYATLVTRVFQKKIIAKVPISIVQNQLTNINGVVKWFLPFSQLDSNKITKQNNKTLIAENCLLSIDKFIGLSIWYNVKINNSKITPITFNLIADTSNNSILTLNYENTLWNNIFGTNEVVETAKKSIDNLYELIRDTKKLYGYDIEITKVVDTTFLFSTKTVAIKDKQEGIKLLFNSLIDYANKNDAGYNGTRIFYIANEGNDSVKLCTSIGITKTGKFLNQFEGPVTFKRMPFQKNLMKAFYQGKFGEIDKIFSAMEHFKSDFGITSMAIPYIKLLTEGVDFNDNQTIQANAFYPII